MNKAAQRRWLFILSALVLTLVAIFYPQEETMDAYAKPVNHPAKPVNQSKVAIINTEDPSFGAEAVEIDPFAPRAWLAAPAPVVVAVKAAAEIVAADAPVLPIGPPALPFRFVGSMMDNQELVVYLGRGEQALVARNGETLEGTYKVLNITAQQIEFEHLPTGEKQTLLFSAANN
jgi:hypothetical protein